MTQEKFSYNACPQLRECYEMAARLLPPDQVQAGRLLRSKAERTVPSNDMLKESENVSSTTLQEALSAVVCQLAQEESGMRSLGYRGLSDKVDAMPDSGEKAYARALLALRGGREAAQLNEAMGYLRTVPEASRDDPRYQALSEVLQEAGVGI